MTVLYLIIIYNILTIMSENSIFASGVSVINKLGLLFPVITGQFENPRMKWNTFFVFDLLPDVISHYKSIRVFFDLVMTRAHEKTNVLEVKLITVQVKLNTVIFLFMLWYFNSILILIFYILGAMTIVMLLYYHVCNSFSMFMQNLCTYKTF